MTGVILVVDDVPANVKLLEAKLTNEYYDVVTAKDGYEAIAQTKEHKPDLILLDVMMPGMDGFETCKKIKEDPDVSHIPIVMVTALSEMSDRVQGLQSGADDFITKPINDTALFARVKSLVRIKVLIDELRLRDQSGAQMGIMSEIQQGGIDVSGSQIMVIDDDAVQSKRIKEALSDEHQVKIFSDHNEGLDDAKANPPDLIIISTMLSDIDGLRLATQFKAIEDLRNVPIVTLVDEDDTQTMLKALELGVNDYLVVPPDSSEMAARVQTQLRRKKYQDALKSNYKESVSMAITDGLTGLYNRHYLDTHLKNLVESSLENHKVMSMIIMDMDHFKSVNDTYGHDVGDEVLKQLAKVIIDSTRSADLAARYGGEEFVILMPETDFQSAYDVADRIRGTIEQTPFIVSHEIGQLTKTVSIGVSSLNQSGDAPETMLKRADTALYEAKNTGRNQVCPKENPMPAGAPASAPVAPIQPPAEPAPQPQPQPQAAPAPAPAVPPVEQIAPPVAPVPTAPVQAAPATPPAEVAPMFPQEPTPQPTAPVAPPPQPQPVQTPVAQPVAPPVQPQPAPQPIQQPVAAQPAPPPPVQHSYQPAPPAPAPAPEPPQPAAAPQPAAEHQPEQPASRAGPMPMFDPNLTDKLKQEGPATAPTQLKPENEGPVELSFKKPLRSAEEEKQAINSPIDDEPPGTF